MRLRLLLLLCFSLLVFALSRLANLAHNYSKTKSLSLLPMRALVNASDLSIKEMKKILEIRGVKIFRGVTKQELLELIEDTGSVSYEQKLMLNVDDKHQTISDGIDFDILVKESESWSAMLSYSTSFRKLTFPNIKKAIVDSFSSRFRRRVTYSDVIRDVTNGSNIWLVVVNDGSKTGIKSETFNSLARIRSAFGIKTGVLDCSIDRETCINNRFKSGSVLLLMPESHPYNGKANTGKIIIKKKIIDYDSISSVDQILTWIHKMVISSIEPIEEIAHFDQWLSPKRLTTGDISVIYLTRLDDTPLMFSTLSVKFSSQFNFRKYKVKSKVIYSEVLENIHNLSVSTVVFTMASGKHYVYGNKPGEDINHNSLEVFMRSLVANTDNNIYHLIAHIMNICLALHSLFWIKAPNFLSRVLHLIYGYIKYNLRFMILWLIYVDIAYKNLPSNIFDCITSFCSYLYECAVTYELASIVRYDYTHFYNGYLIFFAFLVTGLLLWCIRRKFFDTANNNDDTVNSNYDVNDLQFALKWFCIATYRGLAQIVRQFRNNQNHNNANADNYFAHNAQLREYWTEVFRYYIVSSLYGTPPLTAEEIDSIAIIDVTEEHVRQQQQCSICLNQFSIGDSVKRLVCAHLFHAECVQQWLLRHGTCPLCRKGLTDFSSYTNAFANRQDSQPSNNDAVLAINEQNDVDVNDDDNDDNNDYENEAESSDDWSSWDGLLSDSGVSEHIDDDNSVEETDIFDDGLHIEQLSL